MYGGTTVIVAVVGSGGKTTYIREQAKKYLAQGKRVLVTTTTHMYAETDTLFTNDATEIGACLQTKGYCMAGQREEQSGNFADDGVQQSESMRRPEGENRRLAKIRALPPDVLALAAQYADVVLVEADGSKGRPVKFPAAHEPVIPAGTDRIVIVMGFFAVGQMIGEACHRPELVCRCLGASPDHHLTEADLEKLVEEGYRAPLTRRYPQAKIILKKSL